MSKRYADWDDTLAAQLRNAEFAKEFILASVEEGLTLNDILNKVVRAYGVKEFGETVGMADSNLLRTLGPNGNPTQKTLNQILKPFGLQLTIGPLTEVA
jgi:DNA-binding phage protein